MVSLFFLFLFLIWPHLMAYRILVHQPGIESGPRQWKCRVLTTGPPGNSLVSLLNFSHYNRCVVVSHCILICISLMAEHLFMCLFTLLGAMSMFFVYFIIESLVLLFWICDLLDSVKLCSFFVGIWFWFFNIDIKVNFRKTRIKTQCLSWTPGLGGSRNLPSFPILCPFWTVSPSLCKALDVWCHFSDCCKVVFSYILWLTPLMGIGM